MHPGRSSAPASKGAPLKQLGNRTRHHRGAFGQQPRLGCAGRSAFYPPDGVNRDTNKEGDDDNLLTLVLVKTQGNWLLAAGHNTGVRASAQANNPVGKPTLNPSDATKKAAQH